VLVAVLATGATTDGVRVRSERGEDVTAKAKPKPKPKRVAGLPCDAADVPRWAEALRAERVNATGQAIVDVLERAVTDLIASEKSWEVAQLAKVCEQLFRAMLQADRSSEAAELAALRQRADRLEGEAGRLRALN
jgi:hypothetical protein